jgi:hypothetical protein
VYRLLSVALLVTLVAGRCAAADPEVPMPAPEEGCLLAAAEAPAEAQRLSVAVDYILWWLREGRMPPTLTTSSQASRGLLGQPDTRILYGDDRLETRHGDRFNGVRPTINYWFGDGQGIGVEASAFFLERDSTHLKATSDGSTLLARVYENPDGSPASAILAGDDAKGARSGGFVGYTRIELFGEEANVFAPLIQSDRCRVDVLAGARFLQMRDRTDLTAAGHILPQQTTLYGLEDHYRVENAYYGGQLGLRGDACYGRWFVNLRGEIGLGGNVEQVRAFGSSIFQTPQQRLATPTGLTVQASNSGTFDRTELNMVSEVGLNVGCRVTQCVRLYVGYTFLLWDNPLRSGDQIDPVVNTNPGTPPARPGIPFKSDLFWAQGLNAGVELIW